jgi:branched-chain amino acid transport system permease protein
MNWTTSGDVLIMSILGGVGTLLGPVLGVGLFEVLRDQLERLTDRWYGVLGLFFVAVTIFAPGGVMGMIRSVRRRLQPAG